MVLRTAPFSGRTQHLMLPSVVRLHGSCDFHYISLASYCRTFFPTRTDWSRPVARRAYATVDTCTLRHASLFVLHAKLYKFVLVAILSPPGIHRSGDLPPYGRPELRSHRRCRGVVHSPFHLGDEPALPFLFASPEAADIHPSEPSHPVNYWHHGDSSPLPRSRPSRNSPGHPRDTSAPSAQRSGGAAASRTAEKLGPQTTRPWPRSRGEGRPGPPP